jgi:hypothetical protein
VRNVPKTSHHAVFVVIIDGYHDQPAVADIQHWFDTCQPVPLSCRKPKQKGLDWRVTKASGKRGYGAIRVSLIDDADQYHNFSGPSFDYSAPFRYRWKQFYLRSSLLKNITPNTPMMFNVSGQEPLQVNLPSPTDGIRAVIFGDPCTKNTFLFPVKQPHACWPGIAGKVGQNFPALLDLAAPDIDAWAMLGDNFYDRNGTITSEFFSSLGSTIKSKFFFTVIGNHDYWVYGVQHAQVLHTYYNSMCIDNVNVDVYSLVSCNCVHASSLGTD